MSLSRPPELFLHVFFFFFFSTLLLLHVSTSIYISLLIQFYPDIVNKCMIKAMRACVFFEFRGKQWYRKVKKKRRKKKKIHSKHSLHVHCGNCCVCLVLVLVWWTHEYKHIRFVGAYVIHMKWLTTAYELWVLSMVSSVCVRNELRIQHSRTRCCKHYKKYMQRRIVCHFPYTTHADRSTEWNRILQILQSSNDMHFIGQSNSDLSGFNQSIMCQYLLSIDNHTRT